MKLYVTVEGYYSITEKESVNKWEYRLSIVKCDQLTIAYRSQTKNFVDQLENEEQVRNKI